MCEFFSFITFKGVPKYIGASSRRGRFRRDGNGGDPDSHAIICNHLKIRYDSCNAYEYTSHWNSGTGTVYWRLVEDGINDREHFDSDRVERWVKRFAQSDEFQEILKLQAAKEPYLVKTLARKHWTDRRVAHALRNDPTDIRFFKRPKVSWMLCALRVNQNVLDDCEFACGGRLPVPVQMWAIKRWPHLIRVLKNPCATAKKWAKAHLSECDAPY